MVDDDATATFLTQRTLKKSGIGVDVLTAAHGLEALQIVKRVCQEEECPELILLDLNMPVMDGFEFLDELQTSADLSSADIKIVIVSSFRHHMDLVRANNYPVIDCIEKPLTT
ncbi:Non-specific serine/threonine protein kinase [Adhaeribacter pallidiroseus]|uniref:Non-specific serine/threonine protein kinase n=1 Tax=Adhaeribacter pallidiroseus TaxID=2072847 RepID=A0A369Q5P2_9BACT|nr:Non-specific serine/threonine protein kinase [Adhaeribacter pallidiroseus]